jgi:predicted  nucleic acid-binding Zn-ribbon protein
MKINHENLNEKEVIQYIDNVLIPNIEKNLKSLNSNEELRIELSPKIFNIIFSSFKLFPNIIKKNMEEFEQTQKIIADSLLEKNTIEKIRDKLQKKKKKSKNIKKEEEESTSKMIREAKKSKIENLIKNDVNLKEFIEGLENELEEKENFIRQLLFYEYIHGENIKEYEQKINDQFNQIAIFRDKINDLELKNKNIVNEKDKLNKSIHQLNQEIALLKDKEIQSNRKYVELMKKNEELNKCNSDLSEKNEELNKCNSDLSEKNEELNKCNSNLSEKNKELNKSNSDLSSENNKLNEDLYGKKCENERLRKDIFLLNLKIQSKDSKINKLEKANEYVKLELQKLTTEFNNLKKAI